MRELAVLLRFLQDSLGNVKDREGTGRFLLPRDPEGRLIFMPSWHHANMRWASQVLNKRQGEIRRIFWDPVVVPVEAPVWRRRYSGEAGGRRYALHEVLAAGNSVVIHCVVPTSISDADLLELMRLAGQYRGLSPWRPAENGFFEVREVGIGSKPRREKTG